MPLTLKSLRDDDGLVSMQQVTLNPTKPRELTLKTTNQKVFVAPHAFGVVDFVSPRADLVPITKLMLHENELGLKRMPIFGVHFDKGLEKAADAKPGMLLKSMYKAAQPDGTLEFGTCATLVTHIQRATDHIQIEAWQFLEPDLETFYLHGLLDPALGSFRHLDGATMRHDKQDAETLFQHGMKMKGINYQKWFRLDGSIARDDAVAIAKAYFPLEALLVEYFETHAECDA